MLGRWREPLSMKIGDRKPYAFKPARRVFAGRGRSWMTFGEWRISFFSMLFGGAVAAGWMISAPAPLDRLALPQPSSAEDAKAPAATQAAAPTGSEAAPVIEAAAQAVVEEPVDVSHYIAPAAGALDGETLLLEGVETHIALWGVEAPAGGEPGFDSASRKLAALIEDQVLACDSMGPGPGEGLFARCFLENGEELNATLSDSRAIPTLSPDDYYPAGE